jgi:hypothetical protein
MRGMSSSSPRPKSVVGTSGTPAVNLPLSALIERYLAASGGYGKAAALSAFGLSRAETESAFSQFDEDYMISRFFHFSRQSGEPYQINGFPQTHVAIDAAVQAIL